MAIVVSISGRLIEAEAWEIDSDTANYWSEREYQIGSNLDRIPRSGDSEHYWMGALVTHDNLVEVLDSSTGKTLDSFTLEELTEYQGEIHLTPLPKNKRYLFQAETQKGTVDYIFTDTDEYKRDDLAFWAYSVGQFSEGWACITECFLGEEEQYPELVASRGISRSYWVE